MHVIIFKDVNKKRVFCNLAILLTYTSTRKGGNTKQISKKKKVQSRGKPPFSIFNYPIRFDFVCSSVRDIFIPTFSAYSDFFFPISCFFFLSHYTVPFLFFCVSDKQTNKQEESRSFCLTVCELCLYPLFFFCVQPRSEKKKKENQIN